MSSLVRHAAKKMLRSQALSDNWSVSSTRAKTTFNDLRKRFISSSNWLAWTFAIASGILILKDVLEDQLAAQNFSLVRSAVKDAVQSSVRIEWTQFDERDYSNSTGYGSGFIVDSNGLIMTNAHVVKYQPEFVVSVLLNDGRTFEGIVQSIDPLNDMAIVKIQCKNLPEIKLATSSEVQSGDQVYIIGSPLGQFNTITAGIVQSQIPAKEHGFAYSNVTTIVSTAYSTFGCSGGLLLNIKGEAIGVSSWHFSNLSFAISIDDAKQFLKLSKENQNLDTYPRVINFKDSSLIPLTPKVQELLKRRGIEIPTIIESGFLVLYVGQHARLLDRNLLSGDIVLNVPKDSFAFIKKILTTNVHKTVLRNGKILYL